MNRKKTKESKEGEKGYREGERREKRRWDEGREEGRERKLSVLQAFLTYSSILNVNDKHWD